jgi:hypothetical protein
MRRENVISFPSYLDQALSRSGYFGRTAEVEGGILRCTCEIDHLIDLDGSLFELVEGGFVVSLQD